ncbi:hypothetical protein M3206_18540 [Fictibacillus phosphorivorans]|nr:hypothetical protein [Fictibacillus phosphorivorans]MCM3778006.1 hypothetical protein [Fictibacillus phosphorivorans]
MIISLVLSSLLTGIAFFL